MPVIAIAPCGKLPDYEESVRRAGGDVRALVRTADSPADIVASVQGVLLTGGGDVLPAIYGAIAHPTFDPAEPGRDEYEIELVRLALAADLPVFAICRGIQVLNVALGGTLHQDIASDLRSPIAHTQRERREQPTHAVKVQEDSRLAELLGQLEVEVNSFHHQAIKDLGRGLRAVGAAPDGVVEGAEVVGHPFAVAVQWHPEELIGHDPASRNLFRAVVEAAGRSRRGAEGVRGPSRHSVR
jgi:putative glutamine amidotransferase